MLHPKSTTFLKSSGRELSHGGTHNIGSTTKNPRKLAKRKKKAVFCIFLCSSVKKIQMAPNRTILVQEEMPTTHLKAYVPNFPKHPWESRKSLKLRELCPSKVRWSRFVSLKNAVFSALFWRKSLFWPTSTKSTPPHDRHIRKAVRLSFLHVPQQ